MTFSLRTLPPKYILDRADTSFCVEAVEEGLAAGQIHLVRRQFHIGNCRWMVEDEQYHPLVRLRSDSTVFGTLDHMAAHFEAKTELVIPGVLIVSAFRQHSQILRGGTLVDSDRNPLELREGVVYSLPGAPAHLLTVTVPRPTRMIARRQRAPSPPLSQLDGEEVIQLFPLDEGRSSAQGVSLRKLTADQIHRVIQTNLALDADVAPADMIGAEPHRGEWADRPRPRFGQ